MNSAYSEDGFSVSDCGRSMTGNVGKNVNNLCQASQEFYREVLEHYLPDNVHGVRTVEFSGVNQSSVIPALRGCEVEPG